MILIRDLKYRYHLDQPWILKNFTAHWTAGKIIHLFGPNGSGKSTLLKLIIGLLKPIQGSIECHNLYYFINQSTDLNHFLTVLEQFISQLFFSGLSLDDLKTIDPRQVLSDWGFQDKLLSQQTRDLSLGQKRRLYLATLSVLLKYAGSGSQRAIPIWLLDEPELNLDTMGQNQLANMIQQFVCNQPHLVVLTSHHCDWIERLKNQCANQWVSISL